MTATGEKRVWTLKTDPGFQNLIRPLLKSEYIQLEANLLSDGCRDPIIVWNGVIVDGHNRYRICTEHKIPFAVSEKHFEYREEAIAWICANQLGRRNLSGETRKFLIGKQYESEKVVSRKQTDRKQLEAAQPQAVNAHSIREKDADPEPKMKTAERIAAENHISHGTVEKYSLYSRAIDEIGRKEPDMAAKILSGQYKISHDRVLHLARRNTAEISDLNQRLERNMQHSFAQYQTTRHEMRALSPKPVQQPIRNQPSVKDVPAFDPDAEIVGLTLTIPSWASSIDRILHSNLENTSARARRNLSQALLELQRAIDSMTTAIKEDA